MRRFALLISLLCVFGLTGCGCFFTAQQNAERAFRKGKHPQALKYCDQAIQQTTDPKILAEVYLLRGRIHLEEDQLDNAIADFTAAIQADPTEAESYYQREIVYRKQGKNDLADVDLVQAQQIDPLYRQTMMTLQSTETPLKNTETSEKAPSTSTAASAPASGAADAQPGLVANTDNQEKKANPMDGSASAKAELSIGDRPGPQPAETDTSIRPGVVQQLGRDLRPRSIRESVMNEPLSSGSSPGGNLPPSPSGTGVAVPGSGYGPPINPYDAYILSRLPSQPSSDQTDSTTPSPSAPVPQWGATSLQNQPVPSRGSSQPRGGSGVGRDFRILPDARNPRYSTTLPGQGLTSPSTPVIPNKVGPDPVTPPTPDQTSPLWRTLPAPLQWNRQ